MCCTSHHRLHGKLGSCAESGARSSNRPLLAPRYSHCHNHHDRRHKEEGVADHWMSRSNAPAHRHACDRQQHDPAHRVWPITRQGRRNRDHPDNGKRYLNCKREPGPHDPKPRPDGIGWFVTRHQAAPSEDFVRPTSCRSAASGAHDCSTRLTVPRRSSAAAAVRQPSIPFATKQRSSFESYGASVCLTSYEEHAPIAGRQPVPRLLDVGATLYSRALCSPVDPDATI